MNGSSSYAACSQLDFSEDNHKHGYSRDCLLQWKGVLYNHSGMKLEKIGLITDQKRSNESIRAKTVDFPSIE